MSSGGAVKTNKNRKNSNSSSKGEERRSLRIGGSTRFDKAGKEQMESKEVPVHCESPLQEQLVSDARELRAEAAEKRVVPVRQGILSDDFVLPNQIVVDNFVFLPIDLRGNVGYLSYTRVSGEDFSVSGHNPSGLRFTGNHFGCHPLHSKSSEILLGYVQACFKGGSKCEGDVSRALEHVRYLIRDEPRDIRLGARVVIIYLTDQQEREFSDLGFMFGSSRGLISTIGIEALDEGRPVRRTQPFRICDLKKASPQAVVVESSVTTPADSSIVPDASARDEGFEEWFEDLSETARLESIQESSSDVTPVKSLRAEIRLIFENLRPDYRESPNKIKKAMVNAMFKHPEFLSSDQTERERLICGYNYETIEDIEGAAKRDWHCPVSDDEEETNQHDDVLPEHLSYALDHAPGSKKIVFSVYECLAAAPFSNGCTMDTKTVDDRVKDLYVYLGESFATVSRTVYARTVVSSGRTKVTIFVSKNSKPPKNTLSFFDMCENISDDLKSVTFVFERPSEDNPKVNAAFLELLFAMCVRLNAFREEIDF